MGGRTFYGEFKNLKNFSNFTPESLELITLAGF